MHHRYVEARSTIGHQGRLSRAFVQQGLKEKSQIDSEIRKGKTNHATRLKKKTQDTRSSRVFNIYFIYFLFCVSFHFINKE